MRPVEIVHLDLLSLHFEKKQKNFVAVSLPDPLGRYPMRRAVQRLEIARGRCEIRFSLLQIVQRLTDSCDGYAALFCQILQGRHLMASFQGKELRNVSREFLNRFRNLNIAHSVPKIKRKCKSFSSAASLLAFRFNLTCKNCAFRFTFVTFRLKRKNFRCSFVMVFGVRGCMYILLSRWVSGLSFRVSPVCAAQNAAENRRGCADYF